MSSLKEQLLKAKLIDKKRLKQIEHQERVERKKLGKKGIKEKEEKRFKEIEEKIKAQKLHNKKLAEQQKKEKLEKERKARILNIINNGKLEDNFYAHRKFFFVAKDGKIPFLFISDNLAEKLENGKAAIVEWENDFFIVNPQAAEKLKAIDPNIVRFYQR